MNKQEHKELFFSFFDQLKHEHAEKAKANYDPAWHGSCSPIETHSDALGYGFSWHNSPEGSDFWLDVDRELAEKTYPLQMTPRSCKAAAMERMATKEDMDKLEDVLEEALRITGGDRMADYGPPDLFPVDDAERKKYAVGTFICEFFPHAIAELARFSYDMQQKHNPNAPMGWVKDKSIGDGNQIFRHQMNGDYEEVAWRGLEQLERKLTKLPPFDNE